MNRSSSLFSGFFGIFSVTLVGTLVAAQACTKVLPHGGENPTYPLLGRHAFVPCEGCHGPGTPHEESKVCIDCHNADRPSPSHNPGRNCAECHTEEGWDVGVGTTTGGHTGTTLETDTPTGFDHTTLPADQLCWDCHEVDRKAPPEDHYTDPVNPPTGNWDCGPCHGTSTWIDDLYLHPVRTPHGSKVLVDPATWVVACDTCHTGGDLTVYDCQTCHLDIFPHYGDAQSPSRASNRSCTTADCHPIGD